ncbi:hypothetical protein SAMN04487896_3435 [Paenibacillus sp. ov031]|uniref:hypothetical protein n=1 Tax=Paenibacillus sp. ov031 TaxID=1761879 RepID=UPI000910006B|nr:hypothetical protein [Paenibacillus sp. ov031]SHN74253.1 hypothetical protein SAMN04487896_3435 [Paenibacillus sp. ov031]
MSINFDSNYYSAHWSYDRLRILQPHVITDGLWYINDFYYIKCEDLSVEPLNNEDSLPLEVFFKKTIKALATPIFLVEQVPEEAIRLDDRPLQEAVQVVGEMLNQNDFDDQIALLIPPDFPNYRFYLQQREGWILEVERTITDSEYDCFIYSLDRLQGFTRPDNIKLLINSQIHSKNINAEPSLDLIPSRRSSMNVSSELKKQWEFDEQLWVDQSVSILTSDDYIKEESLPTTWKQNGSSCLLDLSVSGAQDIRNYLTMYQTVNIVAPPSFDHVSVLSTLGITEKELIELVRLDRVKILLPQDINHYEQKFLEELVESAPHNLMFSRQLALRTIADSRKRNPLLYPNLETEEKQRLLSALHGLALKLIDPKSQAWVRALAIQLSEIWNANTLVAFRGAMGTAPTGYGTLIAAIIESQTGKDYRFELITASHAVEWAGALKSTLCPTGEEAHIRNSETLANMYSGVNNEWNMEFMSTPNIATEGILTIANSVPVLELATAFKGGDIARFHMLIQRISKHQHPEERKQIIDAFNNAVKSFERNKNRVNAWDIRGVLVDIGTTLTSTTIPLAGLLLNGIEKALEYSGGSSKIIGDILDKTQAKLYQTTPDAILVSRMRDSIKQLL